ncbi:MAG: efflux RND transporter periplasmic adaptor subunit [Gemmatimonadaceae bacterium]
MTSDRVPRSPMRSIPSRVVLAGVAALLVLATGCSKKQDARSRPPVPVVVARVKKADVPYTIEANGVVTPLQAASVTAQVEGIIQRVAFREGQDVVKGQVLFEIDSRPYRASYQQALANLARDRANAENAQREAQRYATLAQQDYVTREQADQQRANAASTAANVAASQAALASARFNLDNTTIRAPISGRTGGLLVREGNLVRASGTTPLVVINQVSPILVRFAIPSTQLPLLQRYGTAGGLVVQATPNTGTASSVDSNAAGPIGLSVGSDPGLAGGPPGAGPAAQRPSGAPSSQLVALTQPEHGSLFFIDNAVDTTTGTVLLKASFPNPNRRLWAGEFVTTKLELFVEQNALVVPATAVVTGQQGPYVYVVSDSMTVKQRPVTVERTAGAITVIAAGLRDGDTIVSEGQSRLTPNSKVVINTPQGAPAGGVAGGRRGGRGGPGGPAGAGGAGRPAGGPGNAGGGAARATAPAP